MRDRPKPGNHVLNESPAGGRKCGVLSFDGSPSESCLKNARIAASPLVKVVAH